MAIIAVLALRVHYEKLPHFPVVRAHADLQGGIKAALETLKDDCGRYPTTAEGWKIMLEPPANNSLKNWRGPYIDVSAPPTDPWGHEYVYHFPGLHNKNGYDVYSCGSDGISESGGNDLDDINNWDEASPRGGVVLDSYYGGKRSAEAATTLLVIPFLFGVRWVAEKKSPQIRNVIAQNRLADGIWMLMSIVTVIIWFSSVGPQLAAR